MDSCPHCNETIARESRFCPRCGAGARGSSEELLASAGSDPTGLLERLRRGVRGEFTILRELARGGMGRVFLAHEIVLDRRVAIKVLSPDLADLPDVVQRFQREARTAGKLSHPYIMPVYQVLERDGLHFFTMPYVEGPSVREVLRREGCLDVERCRRYLVQAADALDHAHSRGVIHRDIKPENMLLEGGADGRLLLTDFGIAKAIGSVTTTLTRPGALMGTPYYMSPEVCEESRDVDGRADQYSLGLVAYEMLAGRFPFTADSLAGIVYKHLHELPEPLERLRPDVPESMCSAIRRAIEKDPDRRFPRMIELRRALTPASIPGRRVPRPRMRWGWVAAAGLIAALAAGSILLLTGRGSRADRLTSSRPSPGLALDTPKARTQRPPGALASGEVQRSDTDSAGGRPGTAIEGGTGKGRTVDRSEASRVTGGRRVAEGGGEGLAEHAEKARPGEDTSNQPAGAEEPLEPVSTATDSLPNRPQPDIESGTLEIAGGSAGGAVEVSDETAIRDLLDLYRRALEEEDRDLLASEVYRATIPRGDGRVLDYWFERGEGFAVSLTVSELRLEGESARARVRQRMEYRLERTGEARRLTMEVLLRFSRSTDGWRLQSLEAR